MVKIKDEKGMTLVELLIAVLLTFIVGSAALEFYVSQHNQWLNQTDISDMQQNVRALLDELTKNIRSAGYGIMAGHPSVLVTSDTLTIFRKDSTKIDTIQYYISFVDTLHPNLVKKINQNPAQVFAEDIESIQFVQSGALVTVTLVARQGRRDPEYTGDGYRRRTLIARTEVRNRM
ncbi:MAG: prepilin-type N-terminal cleavage/methylation domain-containing protein [candidate division Zixibacteria bacterium]|nr:prepilin-type N-terminal cleavage/methylation domain-containing protein [candidate division Zixibacteria bacterium]